MAGTASSGRIVGSIVFKQITPLRLIGVRISVHIFTHLGKFDRRL